MSTLPVAKWRGELRFGERAVFDCYVLSTGERVMSQRGVIAALTGGDGGAGRFFGTKSLKAVLPKEFLPGISKRFLVPQSGTEAIGIEAKGFIALCQALVGALADGRLTGDAQHRAAGAASIVLGACATVGITALIDEATGHQAKRAPDELQLLLAAYIGDAEREWAKTFPDELWNELRRLGGPRSKGSPRWFGKIVKHQIYGTLAPDIMRWLEANRPNPGGGHNWHQSLTEFGSKRLRQHVDQVLGIAMACYSVREFKERVAEAFSSGPVQRRLPLRAKKEAA